MTLIEILISYFSILWKIKVTLKSKKDRALNCAKSSQVCSVTMKGTLTLWGHKCLGLAYSRLSLVIFSQYFCGIKNCWYSVSALRCTVWSWSGFFDFYLKGRQQILNCPWAGLRKDNICCFKDASFPLLIRHKTQKSYSS